MDTFSPKKRSDIMRLVHSKNTTPEMKVRSLLHCLGFRFRLHRKDLPGNPDIVLPKHSAVVFVHGCFWHRHTGCSQASTPAIRQDYWLPKFKRTVERDRQSQKELSQLGWNVLVVWECELRDKDRLAERLKNAIAAPQSLYFQHSPIFQIAAETQETYRRNKTKNEF